MKNSLGLVALFVLTVAIVGGSRLLRLNNSKAIYTPQKTDLYLPTPVDLKHLSVLLTDSTEAVRNKKELVWAAKLLGWQHFQPGHYAIDHGFTYNAFLSKLAKGIQDPIKATIIPGQSRARIFSSLAKQFRFDSLAIDSTLQDTAFLKAHGVSPQTLIGHLYPETYKIYWTSAPDEVLSRIFDEFKTSVTEPYGNRFQELEKSENEIITLASIIELEAAKEDEKTKISGLYWNRLKKGMLLQADPTVSYAIGDRRRLYFKDYKVDSPYNTYQHTGLPPGPITNPSLSSIKAALFPEEHDYLYMVARPDGYHVFNKTYAEHQKASEKWHNYLQEQQRIKEQQQTDKNDSTGVGQP